MSITAPFATFRKILFTISAMCCTLVMAQRHEIGVQGGMSAMVGDVGRTNFILQKPLGNISYYGVPMYAGILYRMNFNPYQTVRIDLGYTSVQFADAAAKETYRRQRTTAYYQRSNPTNTLYNGDIQFEYNFFPVNDEQKSLLSPYIFGGIGAIMFENRREVFDFGENAFYDFDSDGQMDYYPPLSVATNTTDILNDFSLSIPFGAGLKYKFNYNWSIFGEIKFRYTFTDNIDYSNLEDKNIKIIGKVTQAGGSTRKLTQTELETIRRPYLESQQIGNPNSKDWVNVISLGISYSFGRPPCYCN